MTTPIPRAAVLEILRTPTSVDTFPDMIRRVEALEGGGVRIKALEDFVADFASAKIDALRYQRAYGESPEDEPDPVVDAETVWAWQADAKTALAALEPVAQPGPGPGELLPCPFCGGEAVLCKPFAGRPYVACETSFCSGPKDTAEEAIAAWNRRAAREPGTEPTPGQFTTMCLAIEDVVTGRGFDVDPWQPIETAPKDGTEFDIWCVETHGRFRVPGCKWGRNDYAFSHEPERLLEYRAYDDEPYRSGWQDCERNATHWQPLPKPPGETTSAIPEEVKAYLRNALMVGGWRGERE